MKVDTHTKVDLENGSPAFAKPVLSDSSFFVGGQQTNLKMDTITSKHLKDKDNHTTCECGNKTIYEYMWSDHNGESNSCPICMVSWQSSQIKALKELVYELSSKSKDETSKAINQKYAELQGCDVDDFIDDIDYSAVGEK